MCRPSIIISLLVECHIAFSYSLLFVLYNVNYCKTDVVPSCLFINYVECILFVIFHVMLLSFWYFYEKLIVILYVWIETSINWTWTWTLKGVIFPDMSINICGASPRKPYNVGETIFLFLAALKSPDSMLQIDIQFANYLPPPPKKEMMESLKFSFPSVFFFASWAINDLRLYTGNVMTHHICDLGERPINTPPPLPPPPPADTQQLFVNHNWQDRAIRERFIMLLRNTTAVVLITLGFMTFRVWHELDSGKSWAETTAVVLSTIGFMTLGVWHERDIDSNLKWGTIPHSCYKVSWGTLSNETFRNARQRLKQSVFFYRE